MNQFLLVFLRLLVITLWALILGRVLFSWADPQMRSVVARFLFMLTEPILAPIRRFMPQMGMLDLSPLIVLLVLGVLMRALL